MSDDLALPQLRERRTDVCPSPGVFNGLGLPIVVIDRETCCLLDCNDLVTDIYGWTREELVGQPIWLLHISDEEKLVRERVVTGRIGRYGNPHLYLHRTRSGREFAVEVCSTPITYGGCPAWVSVIQDVSQRFAVECDLAENRRALAAILDSTADGILAVDNTGRVIFTNTRFAAMWHIPPAVVEQRDDEKLLACAIGQLADPGAFRRRVQELYGSDETESALLHFTDGRVFERFTRPLVRDRAIAGRLWSFRDITDQVRAECALRESENALRAARDAAEAASRAKSAFLAGMSHEMRTPLNGLLGLTGLVLDTDLTADQRDCLETARHSALNLLELINDLLDLAKIEAGREELALAPLAPGRQLEQTLRPLARQAEAKGLALTWSVADDVPAALVGDAKRLRQVLVNLVGNAIKFTAAGRIEVTVDLAGRRGDSVDLRFRVSDTGSGIPAARLEHIFAPFVQVAGAPGGHPGGTGLGLSIARQLAQLMGGDLQVESVEGRGSVFTFTAVCAVTAAGVEAAADEPAATAAGPAPSAGPVPARVLVAEDNPVNRMFIERLLKRRGFTVGLAADGREVLAAVAREPWNIVLMDVQMPVLDGFGATRAIREREAAAGGHLPIVALTAQALKGDEARCRAAGMDAYVAKPVDPDTLWRTLDRLLAPVPAAGR
ncbi:MAG: ATP-binding protein [Candidatus Krumholzibacteriia bacterium]